MTNEGKEHDALLEKMSDTKAKWDAEDAASPEGPDEEDVMLSQAIDLAISAGKGWKPGEKEAYMKMIGDDDYIPPLFAETQEDLDRSGLADAFSALQYDDPPSVLMLQAKKKGNDAFANGRKSKAGNVQYYRDAINRYYEACGWSDRVVPLEEGESHPEDEAGPFYSSEELKVVKSTLRSNAAMAHMMLKNWRYASVDAEKAVGHDGTKVKAWYRLAKSRAMLKDWGAAGDAIESGLGAASAVAEAGGDGLAGVAELRKLEAQLESKIRAARKERARRERARAERTKRVKDVWRYCSEGGIRLGRVPLVSTVGEDEDEDEEARWHHHHPHTGSLPSQVSETGGMAWPTLFLYPSHHQSDFVATMGESEMLAYRMVEMFPEIEDEEDEGEGQTSIHWDYNNEFVSSKLAVYFEVHSTASSSGGGKGDEPVHPESVEPLRAQGEAMRYYESSRALKSDEGPEMAEVARCTERVRLSKQRKAWKRRHGSLWHKPDPCPVVRVHPGMTLGDILRNKNMLVPGFVVTLTLFPENHPAHKAFLKERQCIGVLQPDGMAT